MTIAERGRSRVLVVDDEPQNRALLRAVLAAGGGGAYDVVEAADAAQALAVLEGGDIDLVLLDVVMPGMDGYATCREIKRRHPAPYLPVVLLTALADQASRNLGFEAGADDFLSKPFDRSELLMRTRAFLRLRDQDARIRNQLEEMRQLDRVRDDLAALLVHDLRNPLAGLDGTLWALREETTAVGDREMLDEAMAASRHLRDTIEDLLKIRMIEERAIELVRAPVPVRAVAAEAVAGVAAEARARGLAIEIEGGDAVVDVDRTLLRRAIENLLVNALRYTRPRTTVTVAVRGERDAIDISVADRGPGVPAAYMHDVFEKYGSIAGEPGLVRRGNGLGLYLVKLATEAHGGLVSVENRESGGAVFHLRLPRSAA